MNNDNYNRPLNVIVVGAGMYVCGRRTNSFGTVLPALYQAKSEGLIGNVTVCATSQSSVKALKEKNKILSNIFDDYINISGYPKEGSDNLSYMSALENGKYDCGIVVVPDHLHYKVCKSLIDANIHLLVVKPLTPEIETSVELIDLLHKKNLYGAVEFHKRFDKANIKIRDLIFDSTSSLSGNREHLPNIGIPEYFIVEYSQRKIIPETMFSKWVNKTDIFQYLGVHYVDLVYFFTKAIPIKVMSIGQKNHLPSIGIDNYDSIQTMIQWKVNGSTFTSTHFTNWIDPNSTSAMSDQKVKMIATKGRIDSDQKHRGIQIVSDGDGIEDFNPYFSQFYGNIDNSQKYFSGYGYDSFKQFFQDVTDIINGQIDVGNLKLRGRPTFETALISTAAIEASRNSLKNNSTWITIDQDLLQQYIYT